MTKRFAVVLAMAVFASVGEGQANPPGAQDWPVYGGQAANDHYSSLRQINRKNVNRLALAWTFDSDERVRWRRTR
jgi:quinoprotein glucose dehydrogenase